jgi:hypothetical protein
MRKWLRAVNNAYEWLYNAIVFDQKREINHYLNQSKDMCDLEYRIKTLEKRGLI